MVDFRQLSCLCQEVWGILKEELPFFYAAEETRCLYSRLPQRNQRESGTVLFLHISPVPTASEQTTRVNLLQHLSSVQLLSRVRLFLTPWTAARQASLSITTSQSLLKLMSVESVMPSNHVVLCHAILLLPSIFKGSSWGRTLVEAGRGEGQLVVLKGKGSYFSLCFPNSEETSWFSSISLLTLLHRWSPNV